MNISIKTRAAALVASLFVTLGTVFVLADYAYSETRAVLMASAAGCAA